MAYYDAPHVFGDDEIALAVTIARQLGFGIERVRADQTGRLLASIIETTDEGIASKDLNGIVTSWNRGAERIFGCAASEMIGRPLLTVIPPDRHSEEAEFWTSCEAANASTTMRPSASARTGALSTFR